jgi:hypothetical protein
MKRNLALHVAVSLVSTIVLSNAQAATLPILQETLASPGAASQLTYSQQYGLLFLRNSGSAIRVVDTATKGQIDLHLANQQFTDMDMSPDGQYLYAADWGRVSIGYGTLVNPHYVHRYNLAARQWETRQSLVDAYKIEALDGNRVVLLESDQWVAVNVESWGASNTLTHVTGRSIDYGGDIEYDSVTGRIYHGNSGSSSREINVARLVGNTLSDGVGSGTYGTAQAGGGTAVLSLDGDRFYYGRLQVEALDVTNNLRTFPQAIQAATNELAFGSTAFYDAQTGASLGTLGYSTTVYGIDHSGSSFWTYANNTLYHYSLVPEPSALALFAMGIVGVIARRFRRAAKP